MIIEARNITTLIETRRILDDVSIASKAGKIIGLIGPNGAGKTTLIRVLAGLVKPDQGQVLLDGRPMDEITLTTRARQLAYLPQEHIVHWPISVYDLVAMGRLPYRHPLTGADRHGQQAVQEALQAMAIEHLAARPANQLSGGELSRVLLARALAQTPQVLLADEPTAGLDPAHKLQLLQHLSRISKTGLSVIIVLHDLTLAARFCDHLVLLKQGRLYDAGKPEAVLTPKALLDVYQITCHIDKAAGALVITPLAVEATVS